jgi:hypothetical protein
MRAEDAKGIANNNKVAKKDERAQELIHKALLSILGSSALIAFITLCSASIRWTARDHPL